VKEMQREWMDGQMAQMKMMDEYIVKAMRQK
jgi:hypothetical protein